MNGASDFRSKLATFVAAQPTKAEAARVLGITRQDLYLYLGSKSRPRPLKASKLVERMRRLNGANPQTNSADQQPLFSTPDLARLRDTLLHLVTLVELDLASRRGDERRGSGIGFDLADGDR